MDSLYEIAQKTNIPHPSIYRSLAKGFSVKRALLLEKETGIHKISWLFPEEFFNPYCPYRYQSSWPPDLSHLQGESREWAEAIIRAFPERPPERKEFRKWLKEQRKKGKR